MSRFASEPDFKTACTWWSDLPDIWTPIGWKNHLFRFNVLWNGTIVAKPDLNRRTTAWEGQGAQFAFLPGLSDIDRFTMFWATHALRDDGMVRQGWRDAVAPVLWSEWAVDGLLLRSEVFARVHGAHDIESGVEPLFAWVRYTVHDAVRELPLPEKHVLLVKVNAPHFATTMCIRGQDLKIAESAYPRALRADAPTESGALRVLEPDGRVRVAVITPRGANAAFEQKPCKYTRQEESYLRVEMPARVGACVDLLMPMVPAERSDFDRELALGFDKALLEANRYWSKTPKTAARVHTPEKEINEAISSSLKFAEVLAERNPADGNYSIVNGSYTYADLWPTPGSLVFTMLLDPYGYHDVAARYLEIFRKEQGTITPPGDAFERHPGYLSSPKTLTSIDWLADHGAILTAVCRHILYSGDAEFAARWVDAIVRACEFIGYARRIKGHGGVEGIMPPAVSTDRMTKIQGVWSDAWNYHGLTSAVRVLRTINHPRTAEFASEAEGYRGAFVKALRQKAAKMPAWKDRRGGKHHLAPTNFHGDTAEETRHAFYLDAGPLVLVYAGLLDADDELMKSTLAWFREGPQTRVHRFDGNCWQVPKLTHEMSSCEPCYSWNVFHSHATLDRQRYLEGMYSLFAGALSRKTWISSETRGGVTGNLFASAPAAYLARLAVIDDFWKEGELHLLRLVPPAWVSPKEETRFENVATEFGPVTLEWRLSRDGRTLRVTFKPEFRREPRRVILYVPPLDGVGFLELNGVRRRIKGRTVRVALRKA